MTTPLAIIGGGGFGREVQDVVDAMRDEELTAGRLRFEVVGFLDDGTLDERLVAASGVPHLGCVAGLQSLPADVQYVIGIGSGPVRRRLDEWASSIGRQAATLIHPAAIIGRRRVEIGDGTVICAGAAVTTNVRLGRHVHLNLGVTVGHDAVLGNYVTANPNASISGEVVLDDEVNMGTGSTIIQGRRVGARTIVGAGASVVRDLPADVTAVGVPARPRG